MFKKWIGEFAIESLQSEDRAHFGNQFVWINEDTIAFLFTPHIKNKPFPSSIHKGVQGQTLWLRILLTVLHYCYKLSLT